MRNKFENNDCFEQAKELKTSRIHCSKSNSLHLSISPYVFYATINISRARHFKELLIVTDPVSFYDNIQNCIFYNATLCVTFMRLAFL